MIEQSREKKKWLVYEEYRYGELHPWLAEREQVTACEGFLQRWIRNRVNELDENQGATLMDYKVYHKMQELHKGAYGETCSRLYDRLSEEQKHLLAKGILLQQAGASLSLYGRMLGILLGKSALFQDREQKHSLILYMGQSKAIEEEELLELVNLLFLPWEYQLKVYWTEPFTVMGEEACTTLGQIRL